MGAKHLHRILPLKYASHREILTANGGLACEVFSGSIGVEGADELQRLIVRACNAHADLVALAAETRKILAAATMPSAKNDNETIIKLMELFDSPGARETLKSVGVV